MFTNNSSTPSPLIATSVVIGTACVRRHYLHHTQMLPLAKRQNSLLVAAHLIPCSVVEVIAVGGCWSLVIGPPLLRRADLVALPRPTK